MKRKMLAKLRSRAGESLTETLVALLIAALGLVILAGAISSTMNMVRNSKTRMTSYYSANNAVEKKTADNAVSDFSVLIGGTAVSGVSAYQNDTFSGKPVIAYYPAS